MELDDFVYFSILIVAVWIGPYIREIEDAGTKQLISTLTGLCITLVVSGSYFYHPLVVTLVNSLIILCVDKRLSYKFSFAFSFVYLATSRSVHLFGITDGPIPQHLLSIQMIHVLKMVGLAFEVRDSYTKNCGKKQLSDLEHQCCKVDPSFMDIFHYSFCYIGLITGPYFTFKTYWDWLNRPYSKMASKFCKVKNEKLKIVCVFVVLQLMLGYIFPLQYARADSEIFNQSFFYRWWYMNPVYLNFRLRLYIAFLMAECSCLSSGFGIYPELTKPKPGKGPTDFQYLVECEKKSVEDLTKEKHSYETINNACILRVEFGGSIRETIKYWNMSVQYWFAVYVHKRMDKLRAILTLLASAFWHGVYPGYYLCFLCIPFAMNTEGWMLQAMPTTYSVKGNIIKRWVCCLFKTQMMAYLGMGFFLLKIEDVYFYWKSLYFSGHVLLLATYVLARFVCMQKESAKKLFADETKFEEKLIQN